MPSVTPYSGHPVERSRPVSVTWRLPVGATSILLYLVDQLRVFPTGKSAAAETALRRGLDHRRSGGPS